MPKKTRVKLTQAERLAVLECDGFLCRDCGKGGRCSDWILEVHHVNEDPSDNDPRNLITLCVRCHNHYHPWRFHVPLHRCYRFSELRKFQKAFA